MNYHSGTLDQQDLTFEISKLWYFKFENYLKIMKSRCQYYIDCVHIISFVIGAHLNALISNNTVPFISSLLLFFFDILIF